MYLRICLNVSKCVQNKKNEMMEYFILDQILDSLYHVTRVLRKMAKNFPIQTHYAFLLLIPEWIRLSISIGIRPNELK
jgi:hypothetical protein